MEKVPRKARPEEVAPEVRTALRGASDGLEYGRSVKEPEEFNTLASEAEVGLTRPVLRRRLYARFTKVADLLETEVGAQPRTNFPSLIVCRARELNLSVEQNHTLLRWGSSFKAAWGASIKKVAAEGAVACGRDAALFFSGL